jgi:uncharacterized protein (TIGR00299 family) protein
MRIAYFDTIAGISGDMTLGAFIDAGIPVEKLAEEIGKLNLPGVELYTSRIERNGIFGIKLDVVVSKKQMHHRQLKDIYMIIDGSPLNDSVKENAKKIFAEIAVAEAKVHNTSVEKIHFHEVGAIDSIIDIVGTSICLDFFGVGAVYSSPVKLGNRGFVQTEHGKLPVPVPAVLEILRNYPIMLTDIPYELTTPTGAAIIKSMSLAVLSTEKIKIDSVGYGAGSIEIPQIPNFLRVMIGELINALEEDEVVAVETNIDDMNPEIYPFVIEKLIDGGAQDAYLTPIIMKKGRLGVLLSTLVQRNKLDEILAILFRETTTLGVRLLPIDRRKVERYQREIKSRLGVVKMKVVCYEGKERLIPEFEECKRISIEKNIPLREVYGILQSEFY